MRSRAVRVTLTLLAVGAICGSGYFAWITHTRVRAAAGNAALFTSACLSATRSVFELRSAQQAYVAAGQNDAFWFGKVTTLIDSLRAALPSLESSATAPAARAALEEARVALQEFERGDRRVRGYAASGQKLLASDVIFSDGLEITATIISALDRAATGVANAAAEEQARGLRQQILAAGGAAAVGILVMLLLVPAGTRPTDSVASVTPEPVRAADVMGLDLRMAPRREEPIEPPAVVATAAPPAPAVEMQRLAAVCTDLARLSDTNSLPAILESTAKALDASGLVLWVADAGGEELVPIAAHGYAASVLTRMGTIRTDAENATAAAFRTGLLQTVSADSTSPGAIAAPLVSPAGCRGVMAAEVRHDGERQPERLAAASIVAAQLATIIGPPAARAEEAGVRA